MLQLLAEIESRGTGPNNGALLGGMVFLVVWLVVVTIQIFRHRRRNALAEQTPPAPSDPALPADQPTEGP